MRIIVFRSKFNTYYPYKQHSVILVQRAVIYIQVCQSVYYTFVS